MNRMSTTVQRYTLQAGEDYVKVPLDVERMPKDIWSWKTLSYVRNKPTWIESQLYQTLQEHPSLSSSLLLLQSPDSRNITSVYPVSALAANCNLRVDPVDSKLYMNIRRCIPDVQVDVYVVFGMTTAKHARHVVKMVVDVARKLLGGAKGEKRSDFWDGLGVCTWESLGKEAGRPTYAKLLSLIPKIPIRNFLIDDGWQNVSAGRSLLSFQPWDGMDAPMRRVVDSLKLKGVRSVGVWLTLQGYWISIDRNSPLIQLYDCRPFPTASETQARGGINEPLLIGEGEQWLPSPEKAGQFWLDWFTEIKSWGVDFLKVDNQADFVQITGPGSAHTQQSMWSGMLDAVQQVWGSVDRVIMCMSHNERMLNGQGGLGAERPPGDLVFRNSDDFNPEYPERHTNYIPWNIYQSILTSHLSFVLDFDMFASAPHEKWPEYHALLRALSPGPILVSDAPHDETDQRLLDRLTAVTRSGAVDVVKTDTPASALPGRWFRDDLQGVEDGPAMLAYVHVPSAHGSIIGAWNCRSDVTDSLANDYISLQDVKDSLEQDELSGEYVLWGMNLTGKTDGLSLVQRGDTLQFNIQLAKSECGGVIVAKVWQVGTRKMAVLGMLDKYAPLARLGVSVDAGDIVITTPFAAPVTVLVLDDGPTIKGSIDRQAIELLRRDIDESESHLVIVRPEYTKLEDGEELLLLRDYTIRLSI